MTSKEMSVGSAWKGLFRRGVDGRAYIHLGARHRCSFGVLKSRAARSARAPAVPPRNVKSSGRLSFFIQRLVYHALVIERLFAGHGQPLMGSQQG